MKNNSKSNDCKGCKQYEKSCPCISEKICKCDRIPYNNNNCCYLQPKDICVVQVNDPNLFQMITENQNLYLTAVPLEINTSTYKIESSAIKRPNDTLVVNESGIYSIYVSLKYSFKFNENVNEGELFRVNFKISGNDKEIFGIENTIIVPNIVNGESKEIINTVQGNKLQIIEEYLPYKINISLNNFEFDLSVLNQIVISNLIVIVKRII